MSDPLMRVTNPTKVPPGGVCRYIDPETSRSFSHPYLGQLRSNAHAFRVVNHLPIQSNWEDLFEDNVCKNTPTCPCEPIETGARKLFYQALHFAQSIKAFAKSGFAIASDEIIAERRATCEGLDGKERCRHWRSISVAGYPFGKCDVCGCGTGLKTAVLAEHCPKHFWVR